MNNQSKISASRFFEDFTLNEVIQHATPRTITSGDCALYIALTGARNPNHCSDIFAKKLGYRSMPIDDLLGFHIAFGKTVPDISVNAIANLGYADVRFLRPIFIGDTIKTSSQVIGLKENSNGKSGVIWVRSTTANQEGREVLSWIRWVMVHKNNTEAPSPATTIPELPDYVSPKNLSLQNYISARDFDVKATGGQFFLDNYHVGERINHAAGTTIDSAEHTLATRLYQNNARLHFDDYLMKDSNFGQRLVYGGIVISLCRALSYEGLENAFAILAINSGTHANPTFAGDTIYCATEVIDTYSLPDRSDIGALRLRMLGIKNMLPDTLTDIKTDGKYHENVVLDLDYTVAIPHRGN